MSVNIGVVQYQQSSHWKRSFVLRDPAVPEENSKRLTWASDRAFCDPYRTCYFAVRNSILVKVTKLINLLIVLVFPIANMAVSIFDSRIFRNTFGTQAIRDIFSDEAYVKCLIEIEAALARAEAKTGVIPTEAGAAISESLSHATIESVIR